MTRLVLPTMGLTFALAILVYGLRHPVYPKGSRAFRLHRGMMIAAVVTGVIWLAMEWLLASEPPPPPAPSPSPQRHDPVQAMPSALGGVVRLPDEGENERTVA